MLLIVCYLLLIFVIISSTLNVCPGEKENLYNIGMKWETTTWGMTYVSQKTCVFIEFLSICNLISFLAFDSDEHTEINPWSSKYFLFSFLLNFSKWHKTIVLVPVVFWLFKAKNKQGLFVAFFVFIVVFNATHIALFFLYRPGLTVILYTLSPKSGLCYLSDTEICINRVYRPFLISISPFNSNRSFQKAKALRFERDELFTDSDHQPQSSEHCICVFLTSVIRKWGFMWHYC